MTNPTPHGQVPEALRLAHIFDNPLPPEWPDMVAAAAELRRQHTRIAELGAQIEALSGVQALSAAPAGFVPVAAFDRLHAHAESLAARLLAATPTPPAEQQAEPGAVDRTGCTAGTDEECTRRGCATSCPAQQAAPEAAPGEQDDHQILAITPAYEQGVGKGHQAYNSGKEIANPYSPAYRCDLAWQYGYKEGKEQAQREAKAAPQQEAQEPDHSLRTDALCQLAYCNGMKAGWNYCVDGNEVDFARAMEGVSEAMKVLRELRENAPQPAPAPAIGDELRDTLVAVSAAIAERDDRAAQKMICEILAASTTPPAEQQAQPGAVYAGLPERRRVFLCTKCGGRECESGSIHQTHPPCKCGYLGFAENLDFTEDQMRDFADRTHALRMQAAPKAAPDCHHRPPCDECAAIAAQGGKT